MKQQQIFEWLRFLLLSVLAGLGLAFLAITVFPAYTAYLSAPASIAREANGRPVSYRDAIAQAAPAVVNVYAVQIVAQRSHPLFEDPLFRRFFGDPTQQDQQRNSNLGSGVILNQDGYILTNAHVINEATAIQITLRDGRQATASVIGTDPDTDIAVLKIDLKELPVATTGDSKDLAIGDVVLAIGNPYDFGQTVTQGIVSATGRQRLGISAIEDFIQTDAAINPGNSGGALINARGELIGINTAIFSRTGGSQGIGFAIPVNLALDVMQQIIKNGYVIRGWLGIQAQMVPRDMAEAANLEQGGVLVTGILQNGPAGKAGVQPGDIITEINGEALPDPQQAIQRMSQLKPGETIQLTVQRGWEELSLTAEVTQRPNFNR